MLQTAELKQFIHNSAKALAEVIVRENPDPKGLQSPKARENRIAHQLEDHAKILEKKLYDGLQAATSALSECQKPLMSLKEVAESLHAAMSVLKSTEDCRKLGEALLSNTSWKSHLAISDRCMDALYQGVKHVFDQKNYIKAEIAFFAICYLDPTQIDYWIGLGHSSFQNKHYKQAVGAYSMASMLDPEDIWPHVWAANTFEQDKDFAHAKIALNSAITLARSQKTKDHEVIQFLENKLYNISAR